MHNWYLLSRQIRHKLKWQHHRTLFGDKNSGKKKKYTDTLNLPKTSFPISMRNSSLKETLIQKECGFENLYAWQREHNTGPAFILHDGPPYANGKPHVGHAINKILKDITNRYQMLQGRHVEYIPGWDCHGLPIELKALQDQSQHDLTPLQIRNKARKFAESAIKVQKAAFKRWGVMADWDNCYLTFDPQYQVNQLNVFYSMFEQGLVYKDVMPVYWSQSSRTALAESELEYNTSHVSQAIYVKFPVTQYSSLLQQYAGSERAMFAVIWTTTPWSIPANQAICYSQNIRYCLLDDQYSKELLLVEEAFAETLQQLTGKDFKIVTSFQGSDLTDMTYKHPLTNETLPFIAADHVIANKGTGLVHTAPSHGHDDFKLAKKCGIQIKNLLDNECCYTEEAGPELAGKAISKETENIVIDMLGGHILHKSDFTHSYPYDWRTNQPVIIRASDQWFINTDKIKTRALECIKDVEIRPRNSEGGMLSLLESRPYWCISRQRVWGVPLPVFYHKHTGEPLLNRATFEHVRDMIGEHGSNCWWSKSNEEMLPSQLLQKYDLGASEDYIRGQDILDIWFDSGSSWASVVGTGNQADVYMEGIDQFGGWFQSSLLTSTAVQNMSPYKKLVVHGFTVDEDGKKMSKSVGNVVDPHVVVNGGKNKEKEPAYGADVLRWWAAFSNLQSNSTIGPDKLNRMIEDIFDLRKTLRFLLANISNKCSTEDLEYEVLWPQDKYMLYQLYQLGMQVTQYYENYEYTKLLQTVDLFCKDNVSKFYSSIIKDRCYCGDSAGLPRQSSLLVQYHLLDVITRSLAPIIPHFTEELYQHYPPSRRKNDVNSIFKTGWFQLRPEWNNETILHTFEPVIDIRDHLHDIIENEPSIEFDVLIYTSNLLYKHLQEVQTEHTSTDSALCEALQTASTTLTDEPLAVIPDDVQAVSGICNVHMKDGYTCPEKYVIIIKDTDKFKCDRCRRFTAPNATTLCERCLGILSLGWD